MFPQKFGGTNIVYARVRKGDQDLTIQIDDLKKQGCTKSDIFVEKSMGAQATRPRLDACLAKLRSGDVLQVWRPDRLGRSIYHLISVVEELRKCRMGFW
ncbi:recombinase family protein [Nitrospira sp. T9]|uniref:recombinase family protein n=1 Tax=unclassified Nitrospira TaxID=2652172 RepID=UPI003F9BA361